MSKGDYLDKDNGLKKDGAQEAQNGDGAQEKNYTYFFIALAGFVAGAICFGISFAVKGAGLYLLIASMFCELGCATFLNAQKRKYNFPLVMAVRVACYAVMIAAILIVIIGKIAVS